MPPENEFSGPFETDRTPYFQNVYEALENPKYKYVVFLCASQMGKTEVLLNYLFYQFDTNPGPTLFAFPTQDLAEEVSKDRFNKGIRTTESLRKKSGTGHLDNVTVKYIAGVRLGFVWATSANKLCSHPAETIVIDELDRMTSNIEGSPVDLLEARTASFTNPKIVITTTVLIEGESLGWKAFEQGTTFYYHVPCPYCGEFFIPCLEVLRWDDDNHEKLTRAWLECPSCKAEIDDSHRKSIASQGVPARKDQTIRKDGTVIGEVPEVDTYSVWISGLLSFTKSFKDRTYNYLKAVATGDPGRIQPVINTQFGELYRERGDAPSWEIVWNLRAGYNTDNIHKSVVEKIQLVTAGIDVQKDCLYYVIRGWGPGQESWLLKYGIVYGYTDKEETWNGLERVLAKKYAGRSVRLAAIDAGYRTPWVHDFCRRFYDHAIPVIGRDRSQTTAPIRKSRAEVDYGKKKKKRYLQNYIIDDTYFKMFLYSRIRQGELWHVSDDVTEEYCRQVVSEEYVIVRSGSRKNNQNEKKIKREWKQHYRDNHYLDCEKICLAASNCVNAHLLEEEEVEVVDNTQTEENQGFNVYG